MAVPSLVAVIGRCSHGRRGALFPLQCSQFVSLKLGQFSASINELIALAKGRGGGAALVSCHYHYHCGQYREQWRKEYNFIKAFQMRKEADSLPFCGGALRERSSLAIFKQMFLLEVFFIKC